ncbi:MAG: helix-turn-helix transcriptional regulator [Lachnospiraceae bacterium]|nr:helix-turn-helix transcriptional regulator [Lachnospiraceae bacterium]
MSIGQIICELRKNNHLKQEEVARYLHVSKSTFSNYENDIHEPNLETLVKLADLFDVSTDYLLGRTELACNFSVLNQAIADEVTFATLIQITRQLTARDLQYLLRTYELLQKK